LSCLAPSDRLSASRTATSRRLFRPNAFFARILTCSRERHFAASVRPIISGCLSHVLRNAISQHPIRPGLVCVLESSRCPRVTSVFIRDFISFVPVSVTRYMPQSMDANQHSCTVYSCICRPLYLLALFFFTIPRSPQHLRRLVPIPLFRACLDRKWIPPSTLVPDIPWHWSPRCKPLELSCCRLYFATIP